MKDVEHIGKDRQNTQQNYTFRGIDDMYNELHRHFSKHEVFITSEVISTEREERQTKNGGNLIYSILNIKHTFYATDGSSVSSVMIGEAMDSADKASNKAMSTALKYTLMQMFLIPTKDEKDTEYQTHEVSPKKPLINEVQFNSALKRISEGDVNLLDKVTEMYFIPNHKLNVLLSAKENYIKTNA
jgi:hypothetical protein